MNSFTTEELLPHLVGKTETGFQRAKRLAKEAGLIYDDNDKERNGRNIDQLEAWFHHSCSPLIEKLATRWQEEDAAQELKDQENFYDSRAARYRFNRQIGHVRRESHNDHGLGLYSWKVDGKTYRSWLGNEPLATPRQIAGKLAARYPTRDLAILHTGWTDSKSGGFDLIGGVVVPTYEVHLTTKLPNAVSTAERLYLDYGRVLDMEDAIRAEHDLRAESISRESYADFIAKLCREARTDPDWEEQGWEELSKDGMSFEKFEYDDTRDDPKTAEILGMFLDAQGTGAAIPDTGGRIWDEDLTFSNLGAGSDQDNGRDVHLLLGLSTQQIEQAFETVGDDATVGEFFMALPKRETSEAKKAAVFDSAESVEF